MSNKNVEIVREAFDAFNAFMRGERAEDALAALADPEFEYDWPAERGELPEPDHLRGVPEAFELFERIQSAWVDFVWEPLDFIEAPGYRVLVEVRQIGRGRESGLPDESHHFQLFTIRDGRVRKVDFFGHRTEALETAGLSEQRCRRRTSTRYARSTRGCPAATSGQRARSLTLRRLGVVPGSHAVAAACR